MQYPINDRKQYIYFKILLIIDKFIKCRSDLLIRPSINRKQIFKIQFEIINQQMIQFFYIIVQMNSQRGGGKRPCKFGQDCFNWQKGTCTFLHDNNNNNPNDGYGGRGGRRPYDQGNNQGGRGRGGGFNGGNKHNLPPEYDNGGGLGGKSRVPGSFGQGNQGQNQQNNQNNQNYNSDNITQAFCKFFHLGNCTNQKCKRPHQFTKGDIIRRVFRTPDVPNNEISRLCSLKVNNTNFFTLKLGDVVSVFQYDSQNGKIVDLGQNFVLDNKKIHWFNTKDQYIYFAYQNAETSFTNIGYIDVRNKIKVTVDNAHKPKVTGMLHIFSNNQPLLLTSSLDGTIKIWRTEGDKLILSQEMTEAINKCFKGNTNFEVLFLDKTVIQGNQVLSAGTSDNRLLFWIGDNMTYQQVVFGAQYNKVFGIKYVKFGDIWVAMTIVWSSNNSMSALMATNLGNMQSEAVVVEQASSDRQLFTTIQTIGNLFFVTNLGGLVSIYKIPDFNTKIGCIMHSNGIAGMVTSTSVTSTGLDMLNLFILQKMESGRTGSFSVYILRQ